MPKKEIILSGENWQFRKKGSEKWHPASVPGCIHTDLYKNRLIPDPFFGLNAEDLQWIEKEDWEYRADFEINEDSHSCLACELVFNGLDTYAQIRLNGVPILSTHNMHIPWNFEISDFLKRGINSISVLFKSPYYTALTDYNKLPYKLPVYHDEAEKKLSPFTRKASYMYGMKWIPRLLTSGIWKEVKLCFHTTSVIKKLDINTANISDNEACLEVNYELAIFDQANYQLTIQAGNQKIRDIPVNASGKIISKELIKIKNPELWWPHGYGEPYRYEIIITLYKNGVIVDSITQKIGIRKVELLTKEDKAGSSFQFRINGQDIYIRGANVIPLEYFPSEINPKKYEELVFNAISVNMNMLRIWGGGIYPDDIFYELCDSHGILVWQDFMFAGGMYPSDRTFLENVKAEITFHVKRLKKYASIALWCGNDEIIEGYLKWGWKEQLGEHNDKIKDSYQKIFNETIPAILEEEDNSRPYWPSTPSAGFSNPSDLDHGDFHYSLPLNNLKPYGVFRNNIGRFMSEFGFDSYPELRSIQAFLPASEWHPDSSVMKAHQSGAGETGMVKKNISWFYPEPKNFHQFLYISQLLQADAMGCAIEYQRRDKPRCMGSLFCHLNDCWPAASRASVDYYGRWKALHYRLKKYYRNIILTAESIEGKLKIHAISDLPEEKKVRIYLRIIDFNGNFLAEDNSLQILDPDTAILVYEQDINEFLTESEKRFHLLIMKVFDGNHLLFNNLYYFVNPKQLALQDPEISIHLEKKFNKYFLFLKAPKLGKNIH
ncbi:MAG: beta-mannosidase, partial [Bacteroidota bacterium]